MKRGLARLIEYARYSPGCKAGGGLNALASKRATGHNMPLRPRLAARPHPSNKEAMKTTAHIIGKSLNRKNPSTTAIYARLDLDPVRASVERAAEACWRTWMRRPWLCPCAKWGGQMMYRCMSLFNVGINYVRNGATL